MKAEELFGKVFTETVTERIGSTVLASTVKPSTLEEIQDCISLAEKGKCPHNIVIDEPAWMYDFRHCAVCGKYLGTI